MGGLRLPRPGQPARRVLPVEPGPRRGRRRPRQPVQLLQPFVTLLGAGVLLSEDWGARDLVFALLVVASVALNRRTVVSTGR
ncbi:MAG: hypothetical protein M5U09_04855 [Gammaproteobacteria bacterium]|nr:hypothetical protein [Gammaproteobacteria bacterium]